MKYYHIRQNNSGGSFNEPAINIIVKAKSLQEATSLASNHITFCGDSGMYAEYDNCGCCPCCGHRWSTLGEYDEIKNKESIDSIIEYNSGPIAYIDNNGKIYMGKIAMEYISNTFA